MSIQLQNFVSLTTTGTSGASTLANGVLNVPNYATSGGTWVDYSATSTIVGWSSFTNKQIKYLISGKQLIVQVYLAGTSNSATTSFTLPNNCVNILSIVANYGINNGVTANQTFFQSAVNSNVISCLQSGTSTWTATGTKIVIGQFFIEIA